MSAIARRSLLRYHGGKAVLANWIISYFPPHHVYVEPFGGAASVLLQKERSYAEVYNDLDGDVVNLFRVLRSPRQTARLIELLECTPFARDEFEGAYQPAKGAVERARRLIVRSFMGFGTPSATNDDGAKFGRGFKPTTSFRSNTTRSGTIPAHDWVSYPQWLNRFAKRLSGVVIENFDALTVLRHHDSPETLFYIDPPYVHSTRSKGNPNLTKHKYRHEMSDEQHEELAAVLHSVQGMVVLSGYDSELYKGLYAGWPVFSKASHADGARDRTESLWLSPRTAGRLNQRLLDMDGEAHP